MNYKYLLSPLLLPLFSFSVNGQDETQKSYNTFKIAAKVNSSLTLDFNPTIYSMEGFAPAIILATKRNNFHEFEVSKFIFNKERDPNTNPTFQGSDLHKNVDIGLGYQFIWSLTKRKSRFVPLLGLGSSVRFLKTKTITQFISSFDRDDSSLVASINLVPQIRYFAGKNFFFDLAIPINFIDLGYQWQRIENPSIPIRQQQNDGYAFEFIPFSVLQVKVGVGVKF